MRFPNSLRYAIPAGLAALLMFAAAFAQQPAKKVDAKQLRTAPADEWLSYGRDQSETHFSPLKQIDSTNISRLGLAFASDLEAPQGNIEGTPIMANGTVYTSFAWGVISATDARTGKFKWRWDPEIPRTGPGRPGMCCGAVNRGVAIYNGKIYASLIFGRLVALDAETGKEVWSTQTTDPNSDMTITGAVRVVKGKVIVGTAGAEFGVRGYFGAYDAETGKLAWRFYTVPGDPSKNDTPELKKAADTWKGTDWNTVPGGGTVWDGMAYDADADLLYIGTGNGSPWNRQFRSPGGGDNLYLCSIVAVKPDTGKLVWYYQTTPGESWDYTSVQSLVLADLRINNRNRKVIMQAPKNGFFYVIDRITGEFISAKPYTEVNWASGIDAKGRPIENPGVRYENGATVEIAPGSGGGHNWQPMAFSPATGLVYIPGSINSRMYHSTEGYAPEKGKQLSGVDMNNFGAPGGTPAGARITNKGTFVKAWDPITQTARWSVTQTYSAGLLATGGNLVFVPGGDGHLIAYSADKGEKVWDSTLIPGISTPISYQLDNQQYVAVLAGRGGNGPTRLYTFMLDGKAPMPPAPLPPAGKGKGK